MIALSLSATKLKPRPHRASTSLRVPRKSIVLAVGEGKRDKDGNLIPVPVKEGDRVLYGKFGGTEVNIEGEDVLIMRADDLYGVYTA